MRFSLKGIAVSFAIVCVVLGMIAYYQRATCIHQVIPLDNGMEVVVSRSIRSHERGRKAFYIKVIDENDNVVAHEFLTWGSSARLDRQLFHVVGDRSGSTYLIYYPVSNLTLPSSLLEHANVPRTLLEQWSVAAIQVDGNAPRVVKVVAERTALSRIVQPLEFDSDQEVDLLKHPRYLFLSPGILTVEGIETLRQMPGIEQIGAMGVLLDDPAAASLFALEDITLVTLDLTMWEQLDNDMLRQVQRENRNLQFFYWDISEDRLMQFIP